MRTLVLFVLLMSLTTPTQAEIFISRKPVQDGVCNSVVAVYKDHNTFEIIGIKDGLLKTVVFDIEELPAIKDCFKRSILLYRTLGNLKKHKVVCKYDDMLVSIYYHSIILYFNGYCSYDTFVIVLDLSEMKYLLALLEDI